MFDSIKSIVGSIAPTLGAALGGPIGGAAASVIANALGCEQDERSITKAIQSATPEQLAEIKKAELDFEAKMKELDVDVFKLETQDKQDARKHFSKDWTAKLIGIVMVGFFCAYITMIQGSGLFYGVFDNILGLLSLGKLAKAYHIRAAFDQLFNL